MPRFLNPGCGDCVGHARGPRPEPQLPRWQNSTTTRFEELDQLGPRIGLEQPAHRLPPTTLHDPLDDNPIQPILRPRILEIVLPEEILNVLGKSHQVMITEWFDYGNPLAQRSRRTRPPYPMRQPSPSRDRPCFIEHANSRSGGRAVHGIVPTAFEFRWAQCRVGLPREWPT
jgi:hypothetical protein